MFRKNTIQSCISICGFSFIFAFLLGELCAFNVDEKRAIVIKNSFHGSNSHFGVSVNLIPASQSKHDSGPHSEEIGGWIFIGAPKGNSTHTNHAGINEPGVIWRCAIRKNGRGRPDDCSIMTMDPTGAYDPKIPNWAHMDRKDGAWIGGTIVATKDRFVTCGSRMVNQKYVGDYLMNGICYWVPTDYVLSPKVNATWPWLPPKSSYRLSAFLRKERQSESERPNWMFGQLGFSAHLSSSGQELIVGAPGVLDWTGSVVLFRDNSDPPQLHKRFNSHPSSNAFSEVLVARIKRNGEISPYVNEDDYFGYSVTSGNFFVPEISKNRTQFVAGAPRSAELSGKVLIFSFKEANEIIGATLDYLVPPIQLNDNLIGSYGSYFGAVLLAVDMNNDGFDDLVVGAPQYTKKGHTIDDDNENPDDEGDEGCIFIYKSNGNDFNRNPQEICGDRISGARFGSSIASLGDINSDGFSDIAVGSPYQNNRGAVYIYHGGKNEIKFSQKLDPKDIDPPGIRTFGYSISPGKDVNGDGYPDFVVGAYESNHVVIFKPTPLVKFSANLSSIVLKLLPGIREFNFTSCISYSGRSLPDSLRIRLNLKIIHEQTSKKFLTWISHQSHFNGNVSNLSKPLFEIDRVLHYGKEGSCYNFTALRISELDDVPHKIIILKNYTIDDYQGIPEYVRNSYEILKDGYGSFQTISLSSNLLPAVTPISMDNKPGSISWEFLVGTGCDADEDPICKADLKIKPYFTDINLNILNENEPFVIGSSHLIDLKIELWNFREIASLPLTLDVTWKILPTPRKTSSDCKKVDSKHYRCNITRILRENDTEIMDFQFDVSEIYAGEIGPHLKFRFQANTSSHLVQRAVLNYKLPLLVEAYPQNYSYDANLPLGSNQTDIRNFSQFVEINLEGPTPVHAVNLEMNFPQFVEIGGKLHELITMIKPLVSYDGVFSCETITYSSNTTNLDKAPEESDMEMDYYDNSSSLFIDYETNILDNGFQDNGFGFDQDQKHLASDNHIHTATEILRQKMRRMKRNVAEKISNLLEIKQDSDEVETEYLKLACGESNRSVNVICTRVICQMKHFHPMTSKSLIEFKLRLKNSVTKIIAAANPDVNSLWFESQGVIKLTDKFGSPFGNSAGIKIITKIELEVQIVVDFPLWQLIAAIIGGFIILLIIIVVLTKCGFFRRKDKEKMEMLKAQDVSIN